MRLAILLTLIAAALAIPVAGSAATTYHGTLDSGTTFCRGVESPAAPGTVDGVWNLNVKHDGSAEISIVIFRDDTLQANWAFVTWERAPDSTDQSYHYRATLGVLTLDVRFTPATGAFVFEAVFPPACIGAYRADHVVITGSADRGPSDAS